jgi:hypothetical protein
MARRYRRQTGPVRPLVISTSDGGADAPVPAVFIYKDSFVIDIYQF